jgi:hypothetical protein
MSAFGGTTLGGLDGSGLDTLTIRADLLAEWGKPDWSSLTIVAVRFRNSPLAY